MILTTHRTWEDWLVAGLGLVVGLTPWLAGETTDEDVVLNTAQVGLLISALLPSSSWSRAAGRRSASWRAGSG